MTFTLYNAPQSTCSQRVRFLLNAKNIPFSEIKLDLLAGDQLKPDYLALNPNGVVPTLDHNGAIIIDSSVIIEYLDEIAPESAIFTPENPVLRARMRALMHFIDEMPAAAVRVPTFNLAFLPRFAAMSEDAFKAFAERSHCGVNSCWQWAARAFRRRTWTKHWHGCAAPTSAWIPKSPRVVDRGFSVSIFR
jgi:glutathione S-transferase